MNTTTLEQFRKLADAMTGTEPKNWEWIGRWQSQRMFGITEARAREYEKRHGGTARRMEGSTAGWN